MDLIVSSGHWTVNQQLMIMQKGTLWPIKNGPFRIQLILVTWTEKISNVYFCILWNKFLFLRFLTSNKTTETSNYQMLVFKKRPPGRYKTRGNNKIQGNFFLIFSSSVSRREIQCEINTWHSRTNVIWILSGMHKLCSITQK